MLRWEVRCDVIDQASHKGKQTSFIGRAWEKFCMDIPGKGSRDWWSACYFYASCTFAGSELWVTGEV